jgi:hypothetical protein
MADGSFPTLVSKDTSANIVSNPVWVQLTDGATALSITSNSLDVNITNATVTVDATLLDIRALIPGTAGDNVTIWCNTVKDGSGTDYIPLVDGDGNLQVDVLTLPAISFDTSYVDDAAFTVASDKVTAVGMLGDETSPDSVDEGDIGIPRITLDRKQLIVIADPTTDSQRWIIDGSGRGAIDIAAQTLTAVKVSKDSSANSMVNPIFVQEVTGVVSATEVHDYATATPGAGSTSNNDYAVLGTVFLLNSVIFAASGGLKVTVQAGPVGTLVSKAVGFIPRQGGTGQLFFEPPIEVPVASTGTVRVIMENRQGASMDVYSTIIGNDLP